jgi:hypothetical protein
MHNYTVTCEVRKGGELITVVVKVQARNNSHARMLAVAQIVHDYNIGAGEGVVRAQVEHDEDGK